MRIQDPVILIVKAGQENEHLIFTNVTILFPSGGLNRGIEIHIDFTCVGSVSFASLALLY